MRSTKSAAPLRASTYNDFFHHISILALLTIFVAALLFAAKPAKADDAVEIAVTLKDHKFEPDKIKVPAGKTIKLVVNNKDSTPEEFESKALGIEKIIAPQASGIIRVKPLKAGEYKFFGEYNEETAKGLIIAE